MLSRRYTTILYMSFHTILQWNEARATFRLVAISVCLEINKNVPHCPISCIDEAGSYAMYKGLNVVVAA